MATLSQPEIERRRAMDDRLEGIERRLAHGDEKFGEMSLKVGALQTEMTRNTEITEQVRDLLTSFAVLAKVAKWFSAIGAAAVMLWTAWQKATGKG